VIATRWRRRVRLPLAALLILVLLLFGVGPAQAVPPYVRDPLLFTGPFAGRTLYVDPASSARHALADGDGPARILRPLAAVPQAIWLSGDPARAGAQVGTVMNIASREDAVPVFVLYDIPHRDCVHGQSGGGAGSPAEYQRFVAAVATRLDGPAMVVLEPDALAQLDCLNPQQASQRQYLLAWAVRALADRPHVAVYLDAGVRGWHPPAAMAKRLVAAGVSRARGFALNVSNFDATEAEIGYGRAIASRIGWKHFVIDTSRNGARVPSGQWCNPAGAALGELPGDPVGDPAVDALLWIKRPGESDGACGSGTGPAGSFAPAVAAEMARRAGW
jgi:endoglucanase